MNLLVVGGGGREHAIIQSLKKNPGVSRIYALPGNGGIAADAECVAIHATDIKGIVEFAAKNAIDFAVVAPDDPLEKRREANGVTCKQHSAFDDGGCFLEVFGIPRDT